MDLSVPWPTLRQASWSLHLQNCPDGRDSGNHEKNPVHMDLSVLWPTLRLRQSSLLLNLNTQTDNHTIRVKSGIVPTAKIPTIDLAMNIR